MKIVKAEDGTSYLIPFILVTLLFFLWGFAHSFLDILNRHFQEILVITKARSGLIQSVVYGGYFLMALPAGRFIRRFGYQKSVVLGLLLYAVGALLFIPGTDDVFPVFPSLSLYYRLRTDFSGNFRQSLCNGIGRSGVCRQQA